MNAAASRLFAEGFSKGYCDVIGAMLSAEPMFQAGEPQQIIAELLSQMTAELPLLMHAAAVDGGAILFMTTLEDARLLTAAVMGNEPATDPELAPDEEATMKEIFDPCMGGGVSHFKEKYGEVIELQPTEIRLIEPGQAGILIETAGDAAAMVRIAYSVPGIVEEGQAALIFSDVLERVIPPEELEGASGEADVQDIMQQTFNANNQAGATAGPAARELPGNIEMILDIGLNVTARLGRIEMPLSQILELGPGSIIEVGHSVDEPVELLVNNKLIARGDVVVVEEKFGLRITEIVSPAERIESLR